MVVVVVVLLQGNIDLLASEWCCSGSVAVVVLQWGCCSSGVAVMVLQWWCCNDGVAVMVLQW